VPPQAPEGSGTGRTRAHPSLSAKYEKPAHVAGFFMDSIKPLKSEVKLPPLRFILLQDKSTGHRVNWVRRGVR